MAKQTKPKMITDRKTKARLIAQMGLCKVLDRDYKGRAKTVVTPGSDGKNYNVVIKRFGKEISTLCYLQTGNGQIECKGNHKTFCYHSLSAILFAAYENDLTAHICITEEHAKRTRNLRGKNGIMYSLKGKLWLVTNLDKTSKSAEDEIRELGY